MGDDGFFQGDALAGNFRRAPQYDNPSDPVVTKFLNPVSQSR